MMMMMMMMLLMITAAASSSLRVDHLHDDDQKYPIRLSLAATETEFGVCALCESASKRAGRKRADLFGSPQTRTLEMGPKLASSISRRPSAPLGEASRSE